jgi:hypothetical protein
MTKQASTIRHGPFVAAALAVLLALAGCAYSPNERIGFPSTVQPMAIPDGLPSDSGWGDGFRFLLEDGGSTSAAFMRGVADSDYVYLYVETEDASPQWDATDTLVVAFNPTHANNNYFRMVIHPCLPACPNNGNNIPPSWDWSTGTEASGNITWTTLVQQPPVTDVAVSASVAAGANGTPGRWAVEVRLRRAAFAIPSTNFFGFYVNAIATVPGSGIGVQSTATQYSWPLGNIIVGTATPVPSQVDLDTAPMPIARWGNATVDPAAFAAGLQITGFSSSGTDPTKISLTTPNRFFATAANLGNVQPALGVRARFQINNIGLNPPNWTWTDIPPAASNPSPLPGKTINAGEYVPYTSGAWLLSNSCCWQNSGVSEFVFFNDPAHRHQCIKVDLFSGNVTLASRFFNMEFVTVNSPFASEIQVGTGVWRERYRGARGAVLRELFINAGENFNWESRFVGAVAAGPHQWVVPEQSFTRPTQTLRTSVLPDARLQLPSQQYNLDPVALSRGATMDVAVRPGTVLTLLADGEATINGTAVTAAGIGEPEGRRGRGREGDDRQGQGQFERVPDILRPGAAARTGALLGSFDGFQTAFEIGAAATVFVPYSAQRLSVRFAQGVPFESGAFVLQAVASEPTAVALDGWTLERLRAANRPVLLPLGNNLPMHIVRGALDTGQVIVIGGQRFTTMVPMGSYGSLVRSVAPSTNVPPHR